MKNMREKHSANSVGLHERGQEKCVPGRLGNFYDAWFLATHVDRILERTFQREWKQRCFENLVQLPSWDGQGVCLCRAKLLHANKVSRWYFWLGASNIPVWGGDSLRYFWHLVLSWLGQETWEICRAIHSPKKQMWLVGSIGFGQQWKWIVCFLSTAMGR